ncbi:MAG TPA: DUF4115 domain-containing protein [Candidatus Competibacter sp.]|nr:hypothetical protein [Candidatus Competibacteraceae bacterium]HRC72372.1 DUF4115 domain-containing protein [Candidatus Competibacter sp.]
MTIPNELTSHLTPPAEPAAGAESLGAWLTQVRASYNAEQREVARHLGLNAAIIEALENDRFDQLGPPVFVRGYLSRYARLLNLPEQAVLDRYRRQSGSSTQEPPPLKVMHPVRRHTRAWDLRGVFYLAVVVAIAWAAIQNLNELDPSRLFGWWSDGAPGVEKPGESASKTALSQTQYPFQPAPEVATPAATPAAAPPATVAASPVTPPALSPPSPPTNPAPAAMSANATPPAVTAPAPPASAPDPLPVPSASGIVATVAPGAVKTDPASPAGGGALGEAKLLLEFSNDCWVEVKDAQGNVLANGLMKANSTTAISGPAPFKVTLGNAPATRILLDDRLVNTDFYVPRRGTVSRFTLAREQP